jgi:hypothetical protein
MTTLQLKAGDNFRVQLYGLFIAAMGSKTVVRLWRCMRGLIIVSVLSIFVISSAGCGVLCADFTMPPSSSSSACSRRGGFMTMGSLLFSLSRGLLLVGGGVYLWRRGSRAVIERLRRVTLFGGPRRSPQPVAAPPPTDRLKILFLAANPASSAHLNLTREARQIEERIDTGKHRSGLDLVTHWAVRRSDLQRVLLEEKPHVLHFSGHGSARSQLLLEDDDGNPSLVEKEALVNLIGIIPGNLQLVVLNACDTELIAEALVQHVACAIGMREPIGNDASIAFAAAFYQALGFGEPIATAFRLACNELEIRRIPEDGTPSLKVKRGVDAETFVLTATAP